MPLRSTTSKERCHDGSYTASEQERRYALLDDARPTRTSCARCDWAHHGTAAEGRTAFLQHLLDSHPDIRISRRSRSRVNAEEHARNLLLAERRRGDMAA